MKLTYPAKVAASQVIRRTPSALLRPIKAVGEVDWDNWHNRMIVGDNRPVLKTLLRHKQEGILRNEDGSPGVRLVYIDPPFGTGDVYDRDRVGIYSARLRGPEYLEWLRTRMILLKDLMSEDGSLYARTDYHFGHYVKVLLDELFGQDNFRNEIIVSRTKKVFSGIQRFNTATDSLYFYSRGDAYVFNGFTRPRSRQRWVPMHSPGIRWTKVAESHLKFYSGNELQSRPARQLQGGPGGNFYTRGRVYHGRVWLPPEGRHWTFSQKRLEQVAEEGRIRINSKTRSLEYLTSARELLDSNWTDIPGYSFKWNFPSENSEMLLERVIGSSSNPGDVVLDAFGGSGTTGAVADKMGRRWIMIDSSRASAYTVFRRMPQSSFVVYRAFPESKLTTSSFDRLTTSFEQIVPGLFDFQFRPFTVKGRKFMGRLNGAPVISFTSHLDRTSLKEICDQLALHNSGELVDPACPQGAGRSFDRIYVVVPERMVDILEDVVVVMNMEFHLLRLPWFYENEKEMVDSARFEVVYPPEVSCRYLLEVRGAGKKVQAVIRLDDFKSQVRGRKGLNALGMVAVDFAFDGEVFRPGGIWTAEDLAQEGYEIRFPADRIDGTFMILFADRYGNERKEARSIQDFESVQPAPDKGGLADHPFSHAGHRKSR